VLREEYGHDVDSKAAPKKKEEPEKKADPGTPENTAEQAPPENTAAPKASEAQPAAAKKTAAKKTAAPARKPADTQG